MTRRQVEKALERTHALLAALVKRQPDGVLEVTDEELANVSPTEDVRIFYDAPRATLILKVLDFRTGGGEGNGQEEGR